MVKHYNTSISEDAARILNSKQGQFLGDDVQGPVAVIPIQRRCDFVKQGGRATTGGGTIATTPADKDTYLVGLHFSFSKNAACDIASGNIRVTAVIDGLTVNIASFAVLTLTAEQGSDYFPFTVPIKIDRNTTISFAADSYTAGLMSRSASVHGYTVETTK